MIARTIDGFNRRQVLLGAGALAAGALTNNVILNSGTCAADAPTAPIQYFVADNGNDAADGLTPTTAWQTLQKVNTSLPSNSTLSLRRGDEFYGELNLPSDCLINAYGDGRLPVLSKFKILGNSAGWVERDQGIWSIDLGSPETHSGYTAFADANIGYLSIDGRIYPNRKATLADLRGPWDFMCDNQGHLLYVAAEQNPTELSSDIRAASRGTLDALVVCNGTNNTVRDVHITGTGGHGISGSGSNVHIHECVIDNIGGSYLPGFRNGNIRYGNAIENWRGATQWLIEKNDISQIYDAAYTAQGPTEQGGGGWHDITVRSNRIYQCGQSFELWTKGAIGDGVMSDVKIEGNYCENAGFSSLSRERPNKEIGVHILTYSWDLPAQITIDGNVFNSARSALCYHATAPIGLISRDNDIRLRSGTLMQVQMPDTIEHADAWSAKGGVEVGSKFTVLP